MEEILLLGVRRSDRKGLTIDKKKWMKNAQGI